MNLFINLFTIVVFLHAGCRRTCAFNSHRSKRVISNKYATANSVPWMVMLKHDGEYHCGAALVNRPPNDQVEMTEGSSDILLTAAHCFVQYGKEKDTLFSADYRRFSAIFGKHNSTGYEDTQEEVKFLNILVHPEYTVDRFYILNDIAMVKLERPVSFRAAVKPIPLSNFSVYEMTNCSITGWGRYEGIPDHEDPNTVLSVLDLHDYIWDVQRIYEVEVKSWNETTVPGDSGSPMTCWKDGRIFLQGITSSAWIKEKVTNFGPHKINFTEIRTVHFTSVVFFYRSNWIEQAFRKIDGLSIWLNHLSPYSPNAAYSTNDEDTEHLVNNYYSSLPEGYNRQLILPQWNDADYTRLWFDEKIYDKIYRTDYSEHDIQDVIGSTKQSDHYKCAIDCSMWNENRPCILVSGIKRCFFISKTELRNTTLNLKALGIMMRVQQSEKVWNE